MFPIIIFGSLESHNDIGYAFDEIRHCILLSSAYCIALEIEVCNKMYNGFTLFVVY